MTNEYWVMDYRTNERFQIDSAKTAMEIVAMTAIINSPEPIGRNQIYNTVPKYSKGLPSKRPFLYKILRHLSVNGCIIDNDDKFTPTLKGRDKLASILPVLVKN